jgi:hypothetical protein
MCPPSIRNCCTMFSYSRTLLVFMLCIARVSARRRPYRHRNIAMRFTRQTGLPGIQYQLQCTRTGGGARSTGLKNANR